MYLNLHIIPQSIQCSKCSKWRCMERYRVYFVPHT